ncbi:GNAT family N-acetyltransferase [Patescibacteria group bacterium]|nr:GNAT family N-acetyltransferase [Patescibacteria group bacterium]MBU1966970.1 GNAT family N-acetyltransferase [Patescibacteria group bacterium]MBU2543381.1 GNAT family N-acetyltransferase [Patescibacteria group bacterium]
MPLTLSQVFADPKLLTFESLLSSGEKVVFRPLTASDCSSLAIFLGNLSFATREFYSLGGYDVSSAKEMCGSINRYDKLRFVVHSGTINNIIALFEFDFDIPQNDIDRFSSYGIKSASSTDCRIGPCLSDHYQNHGVGSTLFPHVVSVARQFGRRRIILWGGVFADNQRAIKYYEKNGFKQLGNFKDKGGMNVIDMMFTVG